MQQLSLERRNILCVQLEIPLEKVISITREKLALIIPNAIGIQIADQKVCIYCSVEVFLTVKCTVQSASRSLTKRCVFTVVLRFSLLYCQIHSAIGIQIADQKVCMYCSVEVFLTVKYTMPPASRSLTRRCVCIAVFRFSLLSNTQCHQHPDH